MFTPETKRSSLFFSINLAKRTKRSLTLVSTLLLIACSAKPPVKPPVSGSTVNAQKELGSILGPITKEKVLDRLKSYPVCGMQAEAQKQTLRIQIIPLELDSKLVANSKTPPVNQTSLLAIECFFFGIQGMYEYALITPKDGRVYPLPFQGAEPVKGDMNGIERKSPAAKNQGRSELCGVPNFNPKDLSLKTLCKGDAEGSCGAYATYKLYSQGKEGFEPESAYFAVESAHFQTCSQPKPGSPQDWPKINLP